LHLTVIDYRSNFLGLGLAQTLTLSLLGAKVYEPLATYLELIV